MTDINLEPILATRAKLQDQLKELMDQVAILKRKIDGFDIAISVMRGDPVTEEEIAKFRPGRITEDKEEAVKLALLEMLEHSSLTMQRIMERLATKGLGVISHSVIRRHLRELDATSTGERNQTRYSLMKVEHAE